MDKLKNIITKLVEFNIYLTQRDNVNALSEKREKEPSNQCMISAFGQWCLQFGKFAKIQKWISQFNAERIEEEIYKIVQSRVNFLNKRITDPKLKTSRFYSIHFIWMFNSILEEYNWKLVSEKATIEKIIEIIESGQSVVCGTNISTFLKGATGHILTFIGYYKDENGKLLGLIANDPFGDCETNYKNTNGENRYYSIDTVNKLLSPCYKGDVRLMIYGVKTK